MPAKAAKVMLAALGAGNLAMTYPSVRVAEYLPRPKAPWISIRSLLHPTEIYRRRV